MKRGKKVGEIRQSPYTEVVDLRLNSENLTFFAEYNGQEFVSRDGHAVHRMVCEAIEQQHNLVWQPVIEFQLSRTGYRVHDSVTIEISLTRYWVAPGAKTWMKSRKWLEPDEASPDQVKTTLESYTEITHHSYRELPGVEHTRGKDASTYFLPYDASLFEGLRQLREVVALMRDRLFDIIGSEASWKLIAEEGELLVTNLFKNNERK